MKKPTKLSPNTTKIPIPWATSESPRRWLNSSHFLPPPDQDGSPERPSVSTGVEPRRMHDEYKTDKKSERRKHHGQVEKNHCNPLFNMFLLHPRSRMWSRSRRKATSPTPNRSQVGQTLAQCRMDRRPLEMEGGGICLGLGTLGQAKTRQDLGTGSLEETTQRLGVD